MKKIFMLFLLCFSVLSSNAFADDNVWLQQVDVNAILNVIKNTSNVKQYINSDAFVDYIEKRQVIILQDVLTACKAATSQNVNENCKTFVLDVVKEHNKLVDATPVPTTVNPTVPTAVPTVQVAETSGNVSSITIKIDLDGGTPVSGNCANEIIVKSGTPVTLDCDAVKNEKHLSGYVDNYGIKKTKNWQYGFQGAPQIENISLKAEYDGDNAVKVSTNNDGFATQESCLRQAKKISDNGINCEYNSDSKKWVLSYVIHDDDVCTCDTSSNAHKNAKTCKYKMMLNHFECVADTCVDGFKTNSYHMCEQEIVDDKNTNNTQSVVTKKEDKSSETYKYACDYNTGARDKVRLKKASDAKTAADLDCVFSYYNKCRTFFGNRAIPDVAKSMFDISKKQGLYYCNKTENFKKNSFAVCCSIRGENVECKPGKQYSVDFMQDIKASFNDCK